MRDTDDNRPSLIRDLSARSAEMAAELPDLMVVVFGEDQRKFTAPDFLKAAVYTQEDLNRG